MKSAIPLVDADAERLALGCLLLEPALVGCAELAPRDFASTRHEHIARALVRARTEGERGSFMRFIPEGRDSAMARVLAVLKEGGRLAQCEPGYLVELMAAVDPERVKAATVRGAFEWAAARVRRLAEGRRALEALERVRVELRSGDWPSVASALAPLRKWVAA